MRDNLSNKGNDQWFPVGWMEGDGRVIPELLANVRFRERVGIKYGLKSIRDFREETTGHDNPPVKSNCFCMQR